MQPCLRLSRQHPGGALWSLDSHTLHLVPGPWAPGRRAAGWGPRAPGGAGPHAHAAHSGWPVRPQVRPGGAPTTQPAGDELPEEGPSGCAATAPEKAGRRESSRTGALPPAEGGARADLAFRCSDGPEPAEPIPTMKRGKGIENPAFLNSPDTPRRFSVSPSHVEVSASPANSQAENSQPLEPPEPQKSREPPLPAATPPDSRERSGAESLSQFEGPCGWGNFQPQCFQLCNTPQGFLVHYCLLALTQGKVQRPLARLWPARRARRSPAAGKGRCAESQVVHAPCEAAPAARSPALPPTLTS